MEKPSKHIGLSCIAENEYVSERMAPRYFDITEKPLVSLWEKDFLLVPREISLGCACGLEVNGFGAF